jgi:hypothetical protein
VLLIGYTDSYWIVKNQWGTNWGEDGFIKVTRDAGYNCKIGTSAFTMFGIHYQISSLLVLVLGLFMGTSL